MRGKRSKQYRKLMQQYGLTFGFREPYQVLVDAGMLEAAVVHFKMDLVKGLTRTLHGEVKPMLTQCTIRHLYNLSTTTSQSQTQAHAQPQSQTQPQSSKYPNKERSSDQPTRPGLSNSDKTAIINLARTFEKRRCDHAELDQPLSTHECISSVIDPKGNNTNKHRYVLAVQDEDLRGWARGIKGVPSIYVRRSVMIMEPMADVSVGVREGAEREKLRAGVKRKRGDPREDQQGANGDSSQIAGRNAETGADGARKVKKVKGPKGVNPLSMRKPKKRTEDGKGAEATIDGEPGARKRRRKHKGANVPAESVAAEKVSAEEGV